MWKRKSWILLSVVALAAGSYAIAQTDGTPAEKRSSETRSPAELTMQKLMGDAKLMTKVRQELLADERFGVMLAHEVMVQKMLANKSFMAQLREGLKQATGTHEMEIKMDVVDIEANRMMSDPASNQRVLKDLLIRQLVTQELAKKQ